MFDAKYFRLSVEVKYEVVREVLKNWYTANKRSLSWRDDPTPFNIWISEIILQQTRVDQGMAYYNRFTQRFQDARALAEADEDEILKLWEGLGYYSRARNLHFAAKQIVHEFGGKFPKKYEDILSLKGVGPYTAAAISSIAFGEEKAVVDGNVLRVISRIWGISDEIDRPETKQRIQQIADSLIRQTEPGEHNQAVMEFGALFCTPSKPNCQTCPMSGFCVAHQLKLVDEIPKKSPKKARRKRFFHYLILHEQGNTYLKKRTNDDIWKGLYEFPMLENSSAGELDEAALAQLFKQPVKLKRLTKVKKHILSHQEIHAIFYDLEINSTLNEDVQRVPYEEVGTFALPKLVDRYLENYGLTY